MGKAGWPYIASSNRFSLDGVWPRYCIANHSKDDIFVELGKGVVWKNSELERIAHHQLKGGQGRARKRKVLPSGHLPSSLHSSTSGYVYENNMCSCLIKFRRHKRL